MTLLALAAIMNASGSAIAGESTAGKEKMTMDHHHHHEMMTATATHAVKSLARYEVPDVVLKDMNDKPISMREFLGKREPLILNFIYTSCTSVCPAMTGVFSQIQTKLGQAVRLVSISIDPEYDTPKRLKSYARSFDVGTNWTMLTGNLNDSVAIQRAFSVYRGDKMDHVAATFMRVDPDQPWTRLDGLSSANELVEEYRRLAMRQ